MKIDDLRTGKPGVDGRYLVFIRCAAMSARDWVEPVVMTWAGGRWHTTFLANKIIGWMGPIPVLKVDTVEAAPAVEEYDL